MSDLFQGGFAVTDLREICVSQVENFCRNELQIEFANVY